MTQLCRAVQTKNLGIFWPLLQILSLFVQVYTETRFALCASYAVVLTSDHVRNVCMHQVT